MRISVSPPSTGTMATRFISAVQRQSGSSVEPATSSRSNFDMTVPPSHVGKLYVYRKGSPSEFNAFHGRRRAADRHQRGQAAGAVAEGASIRIAPLNSSRRVRAGRRLICIISNAETADTPDSGQALLKSDEATIHGTIWSPAYSAHQG